MIEGASSKGHNTLHKLRGSSKVLFGRQRQGAEAPGASGESLEISQEKFRNLKFDKEMIAHLSKLMGECYVGGDIQNGVIEEVYSTIRNKIKE